MIQIHTPSSFSTSNLIPQSPFPRSPPTTDSPPKTTTFFIYNTIQTRTITTNHRHDEWEDDPFITAALLITLTALHVSLSSSPPLLPQSVIMPNGVVMIPLPLQKMIPAPVPCGSISFFPKTPNTSSIPPIGSLVAMVPIPLHSLSFLPQHPKSYQWIGGVE